ncbi:hypothetical protein ACFSTC_22100 [Nonomuraea ferruginea]
MASPTQVRLIHNLTDRSSLITRAEDVVSAARRDLFLSGWPSGAGAAQAAGPQGRVRRRRRLHGRLRRRPRPGGPHHPAPLLQPQGGA